MRKIAFLTSAILTYGVTASAQSVAHVDLMKLLNELPPAPASVQDAANNVKCANGNCNADALFEAFNRDFAAAKQAWGTVNTGQQQQIDSATRMVNTMKPVDGKSKTEQLEAAKNLPGANKNALSLAQQMQDPAFRKKFNAMSKEEKLAYVQGQGVGNTPSSATDGDAGLAKTKQDFTQRMASDPGFKERWSKMSRAEQDAYIREQANSNGTDWKAVAARGRQRAAQNNTGNSGSSQDAAQSKSDNGLLTLDDDATSTGSSGANSALIQQAGETSGAIAQLKLSSEDASRSLDAALSAGKDHAQQAEAQFEDGLKVKAAAKHLASITDGPGMHRARKAAIDQETSDVNNALTQFRESYEHDKSALTSAVSKFNSSLIASNYAAGFTSAQDQQHLSDISTAQIRAVDQMQRLSGALKHAYVAAGKLALEKTAIEHEQVGRYIESKTAGE
jgi:hypothetical protein